MNLESYLDYEKLCLYRNEMKKIFFYRICGTGMGAAAVLFQQLGYSVSGGDYQYYYPMGPYLKETGIELFDFTQNPHLFSSNFLKQFDLIIVGNVVPRKSKEAAIIEESRVNFCSFPAALGALALYNKKVVGIAGTHGKTTTTYLALQVFENMGYHPGYFIGGSIDQRPSSRLGENELFFIESDEYDSAYFEKFSKFRSYNLYDMILTSLEFDHADIFESVEEIKNQFNAVIPKLPGKLICNSDYSAIKELVSNLHDDCPKLVYYGLGPYSPAAYENGPHIIEEDPETSSVGTRFLVRGQEYKTNLVGRHNILNLTSVILFALEQNISVEKIGDAVTNLKMVKRRQQYKGSFLSAEVIDDFAHHPRAVRETIEAIKKQYPALPVTVVFAPTSATARSDIFQQEFTQALLTADEWILVSPPSPTTVKGGRNLDMFAMNEKLKKVGRSVIVDDLPALLNQIEISCKKESVLLVMSNSSCMGLWESDFALNL